MKSIIFNDEMVRAVLSGKKTVTRRPMKDVCLDGPTWYLQDKGISIPSRKTKKKGKSGFTPFLPPFEVGEVVYMRECFSTQYKNTNSSKCDIVYRADPLYNGSVFKKMHKWTPSIHMSEKDSRVKIRILECYAERLNDIPDAHFEKEGVEKVEIHSSVYWKEFYNKMCDGFTKLWDSCYESPYDWKSNPYVWVIEFEVISDE